MSFSEQFLNTCIELLQGDLFSKADRAELQQLIEPLPDDIEELADAIAVWLEHPDRSAIADTIDSQLANTSTSEDRLPGQKKGKVPTSTLFDRVNKKTLLNAIQRSKPNK